MSESTTTPDQRDHIVDLANGLMRGLKEVMTEQSTAAEVLSAHLLVLERFLHILLAGGVDEEALRRLLLQLLPSYDLARMPTGEKVH